MIMLLSLNEYKTGKSIIESEYIIKWGHKNKRIIPVISYVWNCKNLTYNMFNLPS